MDALLTVPDRKEALSRVYVNALAARAGYTTSVPEPDRDSVDLRIQGGGRLRPAIDVQLKATAKRRDRRSGSWSFRLPIKNYRDLRTETQTPRVLVVLELPDDEACWMTVTEKDLVLRRRAYWLSLQQGHEEIVDQETVTVRIPEGNVLNVDVLRGLMEQSRRGTI